MENLLISACLLGIDCKYDGNNNLLDEIEELRKKYNLIPVCPEILGGLSIPRKPAEIKGNKVINSSLEDVTYEFEKGARETLKIVKALNIRKALLKDLSPSCGTAQIYDGTFSKKIVNDHGITAKLLRQNGIYIVGEARLKDIL